MMGHQRFAFPSKIGSPLLLLLLLTLSPLCCRGDDDDISSSSNGWYSGVENNHHYAFEDRQSTDGNFYSSNYPTANENSGYGVDYHQDWVRQEEE